MTPFPKVGILTNNRNLQDGYPLAAIGRYELDAVKKIAGATPVLLPAYNNVINATEAMDLCDGFILPGGRANVHPARYGHEPSPNYEPYDLDRDALSFPLIQMAVAAGKPVLAICRGCQELAVAFGATLHPDIEAIKGIGTHRMPPNSTPAEKIAHRHSLTLRRGGMLQNLLGDGPVWVNSLHRQVIDDTGIDVIAEAWAEDGVIEAVSVRDAPGFALGVQWHPEYKHACDPVSIALFRSFGKAVHSLYKMPRRSP